MTAWQRLRAAAYMHDLRAYGWHLRHPRSMLNRSFARAVYHDTLDVISYTFPRTRKVLDRFGKEY